MVVNKVILASLGCVGEREVSRLVGVGGLSTKVCSASQGCTRLCVYEV